MLFFPNLHINQSLDALLARKCGLELGNCLQLKSISSEAWELARGPLLATDQASEDFNGSCRGSFAVFQSIRYTTFSVLQAKIPGAMLHSNLIFKIYPESYIVDYLHYYHPYSSHHPELDYLSSIIIDHPVSAFDLLLVYAEYVRKV